jgi:hypothetical protein
MQRVVVAGEFREAADIRRDDLPLVAGPFIANLDLLKSERFVCKH